VVAAAVRDSGGARQLRSLPPTVTSFSAIACLLTLAHADDGGTDPAATASAPEVSTEPTHTAPPRMGRAGWNRIALGVGSVTAAGLGTWWMLELGESLGAGDLSAVLVGGGAVGLAGAVVGGTAAALNPGTFPVADPANGARAFFGLRPRPTPYVGETAPWSASLGTAPRFYVGTRLRITPMLRGQVDLGATQQVSALTEETSSKQAEAAGASVDVRWALGADPSAPVLDVVWRPVLELRFEQFTYIDGAKRRLRRALLAPMTVGARWHLTRRQRVEAVLGPRFDEVGWTGDEPGSTDWQTGPLYMEASYTVDLDHPGTHTSSRVGVGYRHSKLDGAGLDAGAVNGIFGPALVDYTFRYRPRPSAWAAQARLDLTIADGGGAAFQLGVVPPIASRKQP